MKNSVFKDLSIKLTPDVIRCLLLIIQSCGIMFVEKQGTILALVIIYLSRSGLHYLEKKDCRNLTIIFSFLLLSKIINPAFGLFMFAYLSALIIEAYLFILCYKRKGVTKLIDDFSQALKIIFLHALIGYILFLIVPFLFIDTQNGYPYNTLLYFFYVTGGREGIARNVGIVWEPGLLQLMLNLLLFYSIKSKKSTIYLLLLVLTIISTLSTTGYFCLALNYIFFVLYHFKTRKRLVVTLIVITMVCSSLLLFIWANIADKLGGENLSGLARFRDLYIGIELIKEKPILGHGLFDAAYIQSKPYVSRIESRLFGDDIIEIIGSISGGFVNGFLDVFAWFGLPGGIILFFCFFKNRMVDGKLYERIIFFIIMCFTFFAEPITYTSFFLIFPFSYLIKFKSPNNLNSLK